MKDRILHSGFIEVVMRNGNREVAKVTDSVAILVYVRNLDCIVFILEDRCAMWGKPGVKSNFLSIPAGRFDEKIDIEDLIVKELFEEIGATIMKKDVLLLNRGSSLALSPGVITEMQYLAYVEIDSSQLSEDRTFGLEEEGERIERVLIRANVLKEMTFHDMKAWALAQWFMGR